MKMIIHNLNLFMAGIAALIFSCWLVLQSV